MFQESPFLITVYDKAFNRMGWVGGYEVVSFTPIHNAVGFGSFTLRSNHPRVTDLMAKGARVVVEYLGDFLMSGTVRSGSGKGPSQTSTITFKIEDDYRVLSQILGWPNPGNSIFNQGYDDDGEMLGDYCRISGPAETVVKAFVNANVPRLAGLPLTTAPDQQRGADIDVRMRFHPLTDRLMPAVDQAGLGVQIKQVGTGLVLDVYEPVVRAQPLTEESGALVDWSWEQTAPTNSRVIVGGQGEGIDRDFRMKTDLDREAEWGGSYVSEFFRDARDVELGNYDLLDKRADQSLGEAAEKSGLSVTLAETDTFKYGRTVRVGDKVTISVATGVSITDVLRTATLEHTVSDGFKVTPSVGDTVTANNDTLIATAIQRLALALREIKAGR